MKKVIADTFYDKTVSVLSKVETFDSEGGVTSKGLTVTGTFNGNVSFSNCKEIQEEYGLDYTIDISITCSTDTDISIDNIIQYNNITYIVTDVLPSDSHFLVIANKWRQ